MDLLHLSLELIQPLLVLVIAVVAWRFDPRDRPLAWMRGYVLLTNWCVNGLIALWSALAPASTWLRLGPMWCIDVIFVSWFAAHLVTALRYYRGRWPARLGSWAALLAALLLVVDVVHQIQRAHYGLGPWEINQRWLVLHGSSLVLSLLAGAVLAQVLRTGLDVAPAHLMLAISTVVCVLQFLVALVPGKWSQTLYAGGVHASFGVMLVIYLVRLVLLWKASKKGADQLQQNTPSD